ncbi:uncharacterized protein LOC131214511, partial [Anopheles bellator]|uniref:uncharacterized protein LOC131214511 n=1 Tax=Anopheles bellator TaxID=139047 RepID=UPI002647BB83
MSEEARVVIKSIRSLVISGKDDSSVQSIMRDYVELNGQQLPYQKFGFANLEDMLRASGEFVVLRSNGGTRIYVKSNIDSAHLYGLTKSQNSNKRTRAATKRCIPMRQPAPQLRSAVVRAGGATTTAYSRIYQQQNMGCNRSSPGTLQKVSFRNTANNNNGCAPLTKSELHRALPKTSQGRGGSSPAKRGSPEANNNSHETKNYNLRSGHSQQLPANDLRHLLNERNSGLSRSSVDMRQTATKPPAPSSTASKQQSSNGQAKVAVNRSTNSYLIAGSGRVIPPSVAALPLMPIKAPQTADSTGPAVHAVGARKTTTKSVMSRLVQDAPADVYQRAQSLTTQRKLQDRRTQVAELVPSATDRGADKPFSFASSQDGTEAGVEFSWNDRNATPVELLVKYSAYKGYDRPEYRYFRSKNGNIQCKVTVNRSLYSTYPAEFTNEFEGQFAAALNAIEAIRADESRHTYEVCLESDLEVANRIYEILANRPNGTFSKRIPEAFEQTHQLLLPDHWFSIIDRYSNQLFVLEDGVGDTIVFACEQPSISDAASNTSEAQLMAVNELQLPWDKEYWDLYITNPASTVEVWARLVGAEYSDKMDALITDIEMSMMSDQQKADESMAAVGEYYLVSVTDCWYRVRVDEINYENKQCQCFFIDIGEKEQMALDQLYQCDPKFLELPGQAKRFTLEGLEDFCDNPKAKLHLDALISGRVFIGEILTKREEYEEAEQASGIGSGQLKLALYDTSSDHDVLLNPIVLKHICDDTPEPALNRKNVNAVTISYIDDQGDVYCQMVGTMDYIQKLITNLTQSNALDGNRGLYETKAGDKQQLYLVQDETDGKWYRAELEAEESGPSCRMLYVDVGCRRRTNVSNIYRLEMLSLALSRYPPQAIRMRMFGLDLSEPQVLARLRALLKPAMRAIAKVCAMAKVSPIASASLPMVRVFVHVSQAGSEPGQNILVCVNDAIGFEKELELSSE